MGWSELHRAAPHGVVSLAAAAAAEVPRQTLFARAQREKWTVLAPGVWRLPGAASTPTARAYGATLGIPGGVVTGWSAAALHGLQRSAPSRVELLRLTGVGDVRTKQLVARRTRSLPEEDRTQVDGVPVITVARAFRELSRRTDDGRLRNLLIDARLHDRATMAQIATLLARDPRFPGRRRLRDLITDLADDGSDSGFEYRTVDRLIEEGLRPDTTQERVSTHAGPRYLDIAWSDRRVALECLGFSFHSTATQLKRDVQRQNAIAAVDEWLVLQLTWEMFHREWDEFGAILRACLAARAPRSDARAS